MALPDGTLGLGGEQRCVSGRRSLERGESFAGAAGERDDLLAFVAFERVPEAAAASSRRPAASSTSARSESALPCMLRRVGSLRAIATASRARRSASACSPRLAWTSACTCRQRSVRQMSSCSPRLAAEPGERLGFVVAAERAEGAPEHRRVGRELAQLPARLERSRRRRAVAAAFSWSPASVAISAVSHRRQSRRRVRAARCSAASASGQPRRSGRASRAAGATEAAIEDARSRRRSASSVASASSAGRGPMARAASQTERSRAAGGRRVGRGGAPAPSRAPMSSNRVRALATP